MATTTESIAVEPYLQASNVCILAQQRHFGLKSLLMDASQYGDDPDSAYGDEVYVQLSRSKLFPGKTTLTK